MSPALEKPGPGNDHHALASSRRQLSQGTSHTEKAPTHSSLPQDLPGSPPTSGIEGELHFLLRLLADPSRQSAGFLCSPREQSPGPRGSPLPAWSAQPDAHGCTPPTPEPCPGAQAQEGLAAPARPGTCHLPTAPRLNPLLGLVPLAPSRRPSLPALQACLYVLAAAEF